LILSRPVSTVFVFTNPISGRGRGGEIAQLLRRALTAAGYRVNLFLERADQIPADQLAGADAAIVIGGDGTLRAVAGQLHRANLASPPPLLIVPMGTANLMGQHLGLAWDDHTVGQQVIDALQNGRVIQIDTATANDDLLLLVAGVGLDAHVVHELDKRRSGPITYLSYAVPALAALGAYDYPPLSVEVDGKHLFGPSPAMAFVGNVPEYGTGFPILPLASPTDGLLDVCVLPCRNREELFEHALRAAAGEHLHGEGVVYAKGKHIRIDSPQPVPIQVDGEAAGHTPLQIDLLPQRLGFIVPSSS
jgi:YegS/Rv2252/BmrU family lipid kinase